MRVEKLDDLWDLMFEENTVTCDACGATGLMVLYDDNGEHFLRCECGHEVLL